MTTAEGRAVLLERRSPVRDVRFHLTGGCTPLVGERRDARRDRNGARNAGCRGRQNPPCRQMCHRQPGMPRNRTSESVIYPRFRRRRRSPAGGRGASDFFCDISLTRPRPRTYNPPPRTAGTVGHETAGGKTGSAVVQVNQEGMRGRRRCRKAWLACERILDVVLRAWGDLGSERNWTAYACEGVAPTSVSGRFPVRGIGLVCEVNLRV